MSCVSFWTPGQRDALLRAAGDDAPLSTFASPEASEGSRRRVAGMARDPRPGIRASAAAHVHATAEVLEVLAADAEVSVRQAVARNARTPLALLRVLATDPEHHVRSWVAAHESSLRDSALMETLAHDDHEQVRQVVAWAHRWPTRHAG